MTEEKKPFEFYQSQPELYRILANGTAWSIADRRIVAAFPDKNSHAITPEKSREYAALARVKKARSKLQGLADASGASIVDVDAMDDEELISAAGDSVRLLTRHMASTFLGSKNVRGLSESYSKLVEALGGDEARTREPEPLPGEVRASVPVLLEPAAQIEQEIARRRDQDRAINGVTTTAPGSEGEP